MEHGGKRAAQSVCLTDGRQNGLEALSAETVRIGRVHETVSHQRAGAASRGDDQDVFLEQFLGHDLEVPVLRNFDVVASGEQAYAPDVSVLDVIDERLK